MRQNGNPHTTSCTTRLSVILTGSCSPGRVAWDPVLAFSSSRRREAALASFSSMAPARRVAVLFAVSVNRLLRCCGLLAFSCANPEEEGWSPCATTSVASNPPTSSLVGSAVKTENRFWVCECAPGDALVTSFSCSRCFSLLAVRSSRPAAASRRCSQLALRLVLLCCLLCRPFDRRPTGESRFLLGASTSLAQEAKNRPIIPLQEKFHTAIFNFKIAQNFKIALKFLL